MVTDSFEQSEVSMRGPWLIWSNYTENLEGFRRQSFSVSLVDIEERTIGTSFLLTDFFNSSSIGELLSTLFLGCNSSLSLRNGGPCHHNVFSASCVTLEPLVHRSAGLRLVGTYRY